MNFELLKESCEQLASIIKIFNGLHMHGLSLKEVKDIYERENAKPYPFPEVYNIFVHNVLIRIEGIVYDRQKNEYFSERQNELVSLNRKEPSTSPREASTSKRSRSTPRSDDQAPVDRQPRCNQVYGLEKNKRNPRSKSEQRSFHNGPVQFQNCQLIGDDFLLGFAKFNLNVISNKSEGLLNAGLCVSGWTISAATNRLGNFKRAKFEKVLVYLGSFDIIDGKELIEMMNDFDEFVKVCTKLNVQVVACSLAPLPFYNNGDRLKTIDGFNKYLKSKSKVSVIDVNKAFLGPDDAYNKLCYTECLRKVSGSNRMLMLWSDFGRDQFKKIIMKNLGHALLDDEPNVHDRF